MGSVHGAYRPSDDDIWWTNGQNTEEMQGEPSTPTPNDTERLQSPRSDLDLDRMRQKRRDILSAKKREFESLRDEVARLRTENERLQGRVDERVVEELENIREENEKLKTDLKGKIVELRQVTELLDNNRELRINIAEMQHELQKLNGVVVEFEKEREEYKAHVLALKDVVSVSKKMLLIRESQLKELKQKVQSIEESLSAKEMNILSQDLRLEYERQLQSIRNLRTLYEERQRSDHKEKEELKKSLEEHKKLLEDEQNKHREAEGRVKELEELNSNRYDEIKSLESNLGLSKAECRQYQAELTVINQLFSEILLGFNNSQDINLDTLIKHLEDHHELLQNIVINEVSSESSSALPKILLNLVNKVSAQEQQSNAANVALRLDTITEEAESQPSTDQINSPEEIVQLLPKVWRVLIELLSHQKAPAINLTTEEAPNPCYKTVQTPKGPSLVLSVSQTFIRLKDLILEKKSLEKETGHLKQLNTHLETRLQDQEKRLQLVSTELNETWHVVGKLQKQHQLLHTQEKILRYELAQKRKLLNTLKEELEYSREKWQEAREKNSKTEKQWKQLRVEFASRRNTIVSDEFSNSQESGYSDERCSSSEDEPGYETDVSESAFKSNEIQKARPTTTSPECIRNNEALVRDETLAEVQETSCCLVSSVIEEAIAAIIKNETATNPSDRNTDETQQTAAPDTDPAGPSQVSPLDSRAATKEKRLKTLEHLCGQLVNRVADTTAKSNFISNKLDNLHERYGGNSSSSNTSGSRADDESLSSEEKTN